MLQILMHWNYFWLIYNTQLNKMAFQKLVIITLDFCFLSKSRMSEPSK